MSIAITGKPSSNLDMVNISDIKTNGLLSKKTIVYVNSALFFCSKYYVLQIKNVRYETEGMVEKAWNLIEKGKNRQAEDLFDKILEFSNKSYKTYFGKFVVCLLQEKEAYQYLKRAIEVKNDVLCDDYYRLYLTLYNEFMDIEEDYIPLLELLQSPKKIMAFNADSYNGRYLNFLSKISEKQYEQAKEALGYCLEMKQDIYLDIIAILLERVIVHQKEVKKSYQKQEQKLEKNRSLMFAQAVKNKDLIKAKKSLETILSFRNKDNKDNYIYYLFLELIETIEMVENDITFEIMPVNYIYTDEKDNLYTFYEAISAGDFRTALESGRKCRNKSLDNKQNSIKVNLYVILLELLYEKLTERQTNIENLYQLLISNIEKGNYKHALNLYNDNTHVLKEYNNKLVNYLFNRLIDKSSSEFVLEDNANEKIDENQDAMIVMSSESKEIVKEKVQEQFEQSKTVKIVKPLNNHVMIFLRHNEPNNEYFKKYQFCLVNKNFDDAKNWLDMFAEVLRQNNLKKRLDYYYYQINLGILENSHPEEDVDRKKEMYFLAYNNILGGNYEESLSQLKRYIELDQDNDIRGYLLLGRLYTLMRKSNKAIECYIKANAIAPSPDAYYFLGELYFKKHNWADAIFCYLTYNEFYPKENPNVYLNLSECYKRLGKTEKVVKYLKIAEEINVDQKRGLYLKDRIFKAETVDKKKKEHFLLDKENNSALQISDN